MRESWDSAVVCRAHIDDEEITAVSEEEYRYIIGQ